MPLPKIKICCISSEAEARTAIAAGASAIGLVGPMPSGPGVIQDHLIRIIAEKTPPPVATFLLTSENTSSGIAHHHRLTYTNTIQIVDHIPKSVYAALRQHIQAVKLVQVIHVTDEASLDEALEYATLADALLLDSGNPGLAVKILGGTGKTHNWTISRRIVEQSPVPVFLAGGLHAGNVAEAMDNVAPYGLDVCSGVRSEGLLDPAKLEAFFRAAGY